MNDVNLKHKVCTKHSAIKRSEARSKRQTDWSHGISNSVTISLGGSYSFTAKDKEELKNNEFTLSSALLLSTVGNRDGLPFVGGGGCSLIYISSWIDLSLDPTYNNTT